MDVEACVDVSCQTCADQANQCIQRPVSVIPRRKNSRRPRQTPFTISPVSRLCDI